MTKRLRALVGSLAFALVATGAAHASPVMPDFSMVPSGWTTDRYEPNSFSNVGTFQGRSDVLGIGITSAEGFNNRPSAYQYTFYNTQGRQHAITGGPGSLLSADLWINRAWSNAAAGNVRTDMWGVTRDGADAISAYPIIGFTNYGGAPRLRVWDGDIGWVDLGTPVNYDAWTALDIKFTGAAFEFLVDGALVYTDNTTGGSANFSAAIMQAYNFFGDPSMSDAVGVDYVAHWSNRQAVPEAGTLWLLGLAGIAMLGLRRRSA